MSVAKAGGAVLLGECHFDMKNVSGNSVVGWRPTSQGVGGLFNPRGFALLRIVLSKLLPEAAELVPLYDQPILIENAGAMVIAQLGNRVGLIRNFRMTGARLLPQAGAQYIQELDRQGLWGKLVESLGQWRWECPRGLMPPCEQGAAEPEEMEAFVLRTAKLEAIEEAGFTIDEVRIVGQVNVNPTFFPHFQYVVHANLSTIGKQTPEDLEIIGETRLFTMAELRALNQAGEFDDGLTLAALALCGLTL